MSTSNSKFRTGSKEAPTEPFKRAVTSCLRAIAKAPELEVTFAAERPGLAPGKARLPEPARKMTRRDAAIVRGHCRFDRAEARLSRSQGAPQADAGKSAGARRVRGGRAGPRRGDRFAPDGGRGQEPHGDARRSFPSRQVRRDHRPRRCAAVGCAGDAGARAADRAWRRRRPRKRWSISGGRCWKTRSAPGSTSSAASPRTRRNSAISCTTCCRRSISATTAMRTPMTTRTTRIRTARTISPAPRARPIPTPRRK